MKNTIISVIEEKFLYETRRSTLNLTSFDETKYYKENLK